MQPPPLTPFYAEPALPSPQAGQQESAATYAPCGAEAADLTAPPDLLRQQTQQVPKRLRPDGEQLPADEQPAAKRQHSSAEGASGEPLSPPPLPPLGAPLPSERMAARATLVAAGGSGEDRRAISNTLRIILKECGVPAAESMVR